MPVPVLSIAQMREWENAAWGSGKSEAEVITRVGVRVAREAAQMTRRGDRILLLAGRGNNGADGLAAVDHLKDWPIETLRIADPGSQRADLERALRDKPLLIIDALFGIGLNRLLSNEWVSFIDSINAANCKVLSVDVPSGLNADSGKPEGAAINAAATLTVGAPKAGMLSLGAAQFVGRLVVAQDVGLGECPLKTDTQWVVPEDFSDFPPRRQVLGHKGTYGHLAIFAGSSGYHGAATLAGRGAQRAQPGLITIYTLPSVYPIVASQAQAVMVSEWHADAHLGDSLTAIAAGPGLAGADVPEEFANALRRLWRDSNLPLVVDASALSWLKPGVVSASYLRVITPHPGEAARMLGVTTEAVQSNRARTVRELSARYGNAWVVLKGHQTLIGQSRGPLYVNSSGNPHMAQGGSGDLLAGFIGGLLAQRALRADPARTLTYAVWRHGAAADALQNAKPNWVIEELAEKL